jgi:hypothetical protein
MASEAIAGFLPSKYGFRFANDFPHVPVRRLGIPGVFSVPIGDASNGLCGGMAFAARDYFEAERTPPADAAAPSSGPLFDYLVKRLFESFNLPYGPARYLELMSPYLSDGESLWSRLGLAPHGRAWITVKQEWPRVRAEIDSGHPSPLGLIRIKSSSPFDLKHDHQVLAYAYSQVGTQLTIKLYDPNWPGNDERTIAFSVADPTNPLTITVTPDDGPVFAYFRVDYRPATPP